MQKGFIQIALLITVIAGIALFGGIKYVTHIEVKKDTRPIVPQDSTTSVNPINHLDSKSIPTKPTGGLSSTTISVAKAQPVTPTASATTPPVKPIEKVTLTPSHSIQFQLDAEVGELHAYDEQGRHTGPVPISGTDFSFAQEDIPSSSYSLFGTYADLLFSPTSNARVEIRGLKDGNTSVDVFYDDMRFTYPVSLHKGSIATLPIIFSQSGTGDRVDVGPLELDVNGDGKTKQIIHGVAF